MNNAGTCLSIETTAVTPGLSFRFVRNFSLFSEGFPTRSACGNDSIKARTTIQTGSNPHEGNVRAWISSLIILLTLSAFPCPAHAGQPYSAALRLKDRKIVSLDEMLRDIRGADLLFLGEDHDDELHHRAQLQIISALHESGRPIALGLEMFRAEAQPRLDLWTAGKLDMNSFIKTYEANWSVPWHLYQDILLYVREHNLPLIGLNIPDAVAARIARDGFGSLKGEEKKHLPTGITCTIDSQYRDFIRRAYQAHGGRDKFENFCEAQMVWDKTMAFRIVEYRKKHPGQTVVVLAGTGHSWKPGIPAQVQLLSKQSYRVVLPLSSKLPSGSSIGFPDADYVLIR